ncbi:response regulator [Bermanella sp. R86510]|uniref:response regulator n=1 Tax=unclassified Bermanella TaxID=2627862 RepID=UPI0037C61B5D
MRILLLEDDHSLALGLKQSLKHHGYACDCFDAVNLGLNAVDQEQYDLVLLDLGLADGDGLSFLHEFRKQSKVPVLILTARDQIEDRIKGLDLGADDYMPKPFDINELLARMRALLRRSVGESTNTLSVQGLVLDLQARTLSFENQEISLSRREFNLLEALVTHRDKVMTRSQLEQSLYSWDDEIESNALEVHIHNLRKKLPLPIIKTVRGVGYMIQQQGNA